MRARPFAYARPASLEEAATLLRDEPEAAVLAGGQSLVQALVLRERHAALLVDVGRLEALRGIALDDGALRIGTGVPMWDVERDPLVARYAPLLVRALQTVGAPGIRSRATLGGSAAWGDPTSQLPATLLALAARVETTERVLDAPALFGPPRGSVLRHGEVLVALHLPVAGDAAFGLRHVRRSHITWPVAGAVAARTGTLTRVALYGAGPRPVLGTAPDPHVAAEDALARSAPFDDERAGAGYRRHVLPVLARRALADAGVAA